MEEINSTAFNELKNKVDKIYDAMVGNNMMDDGGLIGSYKRLKAQVDGMEQKLVEINNKNIKYDVYQKIMWTCIGTTAGLILAYFFEFIIKK